MNRADQIAETLGFVRARIAEAEARAGRTAGCVRLIAASKKMPSDDVLAALAAGQEDFGESYAQELRDKRAATLAPVAAVAPPLGANTSSPTGSPPRWHFLGPIQSNKVKYLAGQVTLIQSVDDVVILAEINKRAASVGIPQACLVQVNIAGETRKAGVAPHLLPALLDRFATTPHAICAGLMLIPPLSDDADAARRHFAALRELGAREARITRPNVALSELSMGMSHDFAEAVAEGATMVRVGTAIFGERPAR